VTQPALIELRDIRKRYGGHGKPEVEVLRGLSLRIEAGEFVAIVGASGSGKSTLMHILGLLDRPSAGAYRLNGRDVAGLDADERAWLRREAFGFVFQGYHLIASDSARENVEVPAIYAGLPEAQRAERASALLARLGMGDKLENRPHQLSGGQQQRVSIARALMNGGAIILADEPTGALDSRVGAEVMALLRELAEAGHTVILITHDRQVAAQAARTIEILDGRIVADSADPSDAPRRSARALPAALPPPSGTGHGPSNLWADLQEAGRSAWRGMRQNRARTGLTLLGVVIGVASVIVMLAIGEGARQRVMEQMGTMGTTVMYMGSAQPPSGGPIGMLTPDDLEALEELPQIARVMPVIGDMIPVRQGSAEKLIYVFAAGESMPLIHHWPLAQGRFFTEAEDRDLAPLVVLGHKASRHFFADVANPVGRHLLIGQGPFEVVGVLAERGADSGAQDYDEMVFIPYHAGRARVYRTQTQPDYTVIEAASVEQVQAAEAAMRKLLHERHGREDFSIGNAAAKLQAEAQTRGTMAMMLGLVAAVSLVVGGIGVMNVMLMTVRERTREIGIRMATGARQRDILRQFLTEAVLVTVLGGAAGVCAGLLIGATLIALGVPAIFSLTAMLGAFACSVATGLVFGYMPARRAAGLDPVVALTSE